MKTDLSHLPSAKADFLKKTAELIVKEAEKAGQQIAYVILFGSYARGDWVHEYFHPGDGEGPYVSDYDIMVIPKNSCENKYDLWRKIERKIDNINDDDPRISLFVHNIKFFNNQLKENEYFYADVKKEGIVLYDSGKYKLAEAKLFTPLERQQKSQDKFDYWYKKSTSLLCKVNLDEEADLEMRKIEAFLLHQVTESIYTAAMLVYTDYMPKIHNITILGDLIAQKDQNFLKAFSKETEYDKHIFDLLQRAYIDSRYSMFYQISAKELADMTKKVRDFQGFTKKLCESKIESLAHE
jgi:predicted nucleotidyltransferase/HEPN domain-containing protein